MCQRYYWKNFPQVSGAGLSTGGAFGDTSSAVALFRFPVTMRTSPTVAQSNTSVSNGSVGATTLTEAQMPSHNHAPSGYTYFVAANFGSSGPNFGSEGSYIGPYFPTVTTSTGGGGSHDHSFSTSGSGTSSAVTLNVRYANVIICSKN
jgi:hypothetical protein